MVLATAPPGLTAEAELGAEALFQALEALQGVNRALMEAVNGPLARAAGDEGADPLVMDKAVAKVLGPVERLIDVRDWMASRPALAGFEEPRRLVLAVLEHELSTLRQWADTVRGALDDPAAVVKARGVAPEEGRICLDLAHYLRPCPELMALERWCDAQEKAPAGYVALGWSCGGVGLALAVLGLWAGWEALVVTAILGAMAGMAWAVADGVLNPLRGRAP